MIAPLYSFVNDFLQGIRIRGTRVNIDEIIKIETITEERIETSSSFIINDKLNLKDLSKFAQNAVQYYNKEVQSKVGPCVCHVYTYNDDFAVIRTIHDGYKKESDIYPLIFYNIWIYGDSKDISSILVDFRIPFGNIGVGTYQTSNELRRIETLKYKGHFDNFKEKYFSILHRNKLDLTIDHNSSRFLDCSWYINKRTIQLTYRKNLEPENFTVDFTKSDLIFYCNSIQLKKQNFSNYHFKIDNTDWISAVAILSINNTKKDLVFSLQNKAFKRKSDFSKIVFLDELQNSDKVKRMYYKKSCDFETPSSNNYNLLSFDAQTNADLLIEILSDIIKIYSQDMVINFDMFFVLPSNKPKLALLSTPLIRYSYGYPVLYSDCYVQKILNTPISTKQIIFVDVEPSIKEEQVFLKNGYKLHIIRKNDFEETLYELHSFYLKMLCLDFLITSYSIIPENAESLFNKNHEHKEDFIKERKEIIDLLDDHYSKELKFCIESGISKEEFLTNHFSLIERLPETLFSKLLFLGQFIQDFEIEYDKERIFLTNPGNLNAQHFAFFDINCTLSSQIAIAIYSSYKGILTIPFDCTKLHLNISEYSEQLSNSKNLNESRELLYSYGCHISDAVSSIWFHFLKAIIGDDQETTLLKLTKEVGLGYFTLFLPSSTTLYETMIIFNYALGAIFSTGRIPVENSYDCLELVNYCLRATIFPKPDPHILSIIATPDFHESEYVNYITEKLFSCFAEVDSKTLILMSPENIPNINDRMKESSILFLWVHGDSNNFFFESINGDISSISIESIKACSFLRPELAILNSCETGGFVESLNKSSNMSVALLKKGYLGVCAPFWKIDLGTAIYGNFLLLNKLVSGFSLSSILRYAKLHKKSYFMEIYVYFGDPEYTPDTYYQTEITKLKQTTIELYYTSFEASNKDVYKMKFLESID